jgi:hypothetical protein
MHGVEHTKTYVYLEQHPADFLTWEMFGKKKKKTVDENRNTFYVQ